MKYSNLIILIFLLFLLCSNNFMKYEIYEKKLSRLFTESNTDNKLPFILTFPTCENRPVIRLKLNNKDCFLLVDSGSVRNILFKKGLDKVFKHNVISEDFCRIDNINFYLDKTNSYLPENFGQKIDGILGLNFLMKYNQICFDYIQNELILNDNDKLKFPKPLYVKLKHLYCEFLYKNKSYYAFLDTGSNVCIFNSSFFRENDELGQEKINCVLEHINVGNQEYENLFVLQSNNTSIKVNDVAKDFVINNNILGAPIFMNHLLKIDFNHMEYEIL